MTKHTAISRFLDEEEAKRRLLEAAPELLRAAKAIALRLDRFAKAWGNNPVFLASERAALAAAIRHAEGD